MDRLQVNQLALDILHQELVKMKGAELDSKARDFAVKAYQVTMEDTELLSTDELQDIPSEVLEGWLKEHEDNKSRDTQSTLASS